MKDRDDRIKMHGVVIDSLPSAMFKVRCDENIEILATLSGKLRQNHIRVLVGDEVLVEVSPYDLSRGRITRRK